MAAVRYTVAVDVVAVILELLEGDSMSLLACALTCRAWYPHAKKVLYRTICVARYRASKALRAREKDIDNFIAQYTEALDIREDPTDTRRFAHRTISCLGHLEFRVLTRLAFSKVDFGEHSREPYWLTGRYGSVTTLELAGCTFPTFRDFLRLISPESVPRLRRLRLLRCCRLQLPFATPHAAQNVAYQRLSLDEIEISEPSKLFEHELLRWLASDTNSMAWKANLHVLCIRPDVPPEQKDADDAVYATINNVLDVLGPINTITELAVPAHQVRVNLSAFTQLQDLTLFLRGDCYDDWRSTYARTEPTFLSLNAPHLRRLTLVVAVTVSGISPWRDDGVHAFWEGLNELVAAGHFARLTAAAIECECYAYNTFTPSQVAVVQRRIERGIRRLAWHAQGILSTTMHSPSFFARSVGRNDSGPEWAVDGLLRLGAAISVLRGV